jgi:hypothetical protein
VLVYSVDRGAAGKEIQDPGSSVGMQLPIFSLLRYTHKAFKKKQKQRGLGVAFEKLLIHSAPVNERVVRQRHLPNERRLSAESIR